jgi:hypothetical protein
MKDRLFNSLDANLVHQYRLRKPDCPFKATQQLYSKFKPSAVQANVGYHHLPYGKPSQPLQQQHQSHLGSFNSQPSQNSFVGFNQPPAQLQLVQNPTLTSASAYIDHSKSANSLNSPFMPVTPANHPMPPSSIYSANAANNNANTNIYRSTTPASLTKTLSHPSVPPPPSIFGQPLQSHTSAPPPQQPTAQPTSFFAPPPVTNGQTQNNSQLSSLISNANQTSRKKNFLNS